jgi:hypothetical protein
MAGAFGAIKPFEIRYPAKAEACAGSVVLAEMAGIRPHAART